MISSSPLRGANPIAPAPDDARDRDVVRTAMRKLWQAALETSESAQGGTDDDGGFWLSPPGPTLDTNLLLLLHQGLDRIYAPAPAESGPLELGANARYAGDLQAAANRTGLPADMLAAIVGAEAETSNGAWNPLSQNPRSSAAGLTQFLSGTWINEAQRPGSWLNSQAQAAGWLDSRGAIRPESREALLDLRYNPRAAIEAGADYARANLDSLAAQGLTTGRETPQQLARLAYLAHHLGPADAARFVAAGGLPEARAQTLLSAQIGSSASAARIEASGSATAAHAQWLNGYVARKIDLSRYS